MFCTCHKIASWESSRHLSSKPKEIEMATFVTSLFFLLSLSLVLPFISHSSTRLTVKVTNNVLRNVCSKTQNPTWCLLVLQSDPRSATTDLKVLGHVSIDKAFKRAKDTKYHNGTLIAHLNNPSLWEKRVSCLKKLRELHCWSWRSKSKTWAPTTISRLKT